jgi:hypothetical protein
MHILEHDFTDRKISPWGGIKLFQEFFTRSGFRDFLLEQKLPSPGSNRGFAAIDIVEGLLASIILGSTRLEHCGMLRQDAVIKEIFGWEKGMASASTFGRFLRRFDEKMISDLFPQIQKYIISRLAVKYRTIDLDSSVITRFGHQEGAKIGYNPQRRGRPSHHPLMAFCEDSKLVINGWMRSGNADSKTNAVAFIEELFSIVEENQIGLIRADVGFYSHKIMSFLEDRKTPVPYLIKVRITTGVLKQITQPRKWMRSDDVIKGAIYGEIDYKSSGWKQSRRVVLVGIPINQKNTYPSLFKEFDILNEYKFYAFVTNSKLSMVDTHRKYNQRGDSENRIKELKYDYGLEGFSMHSLNATDAAFRFVMLAYNLMTLFKHSIVNPRVNHRLSTIKFQCIAIGSYITKTARKKILKLSAEGKRRHFLEHLFENTELIHPKFVF